MTTLNPEMDKKAKTKPKQFRVKRPNYLIAKFVYGGNFKRIRDHQVLDKLNQQVMQLHLNNGSENSK